MKLRMKTAAGIIAAAAIVATPAVAHAATWYGAKTSFTTASAGSKVGAHYDGVGSVGLCGDISSSTKVAQYTLQIWRDIQLVPDTIQVSTNTTYNAATACTSYFNSDPGEGYYNRGAWVAGESPSHNGWFNARRP